MLLLLILIAIVSTLILTRRLSTSPQKYPQSVHLLIVLGSGGHTAEMLSMLHNLPTARYSRRSYIIGSGDWNSAAKAREFECHLHADQSSFAIYGVPRARAIHQSLWTTPLSCLKSLRACIAVLRTSGLPHVVLLNGPATSVIMLMAIHLMGRWKRCPYRTIYVESWARVSRPSLSLRLIRLARLCDCVLVQHSPLADAGWGEYRGVLVR